MAGRSCAIVVPCFNEERRLQDAAFLAFAREHDDVRFVLVDDGSTDGTRARLEALASRSDGAIEALPLAENGGKAEAVRRGVLHALAADPASFGYWDADLATPLDAISRFREILAGRPRALLVMGSRVKLLGRDVQRSAGRHYAGRVFATCASRVLGLPVYDTQCGAKLFRTTPQTRALFGQPFLTRWLFDVELLARLGEQLGDGRPDPREQAIVEVPLEEWRDVAGSKLKGRDFVRAVGDLARIRRRYRRPRR